MLGLYEKGISSIDILTKEDLKEMVSTLNSNGIEAVTDYIMSSPEKVNQYVGFMFLITSCYWNKNEVNVALESEDDGANILSIVATSDEASFAGYQLVQKDGYFIGETENRYVEWDCSHGMTGMWDLFIWFDQATNN